jgi:hypothetical protein
MLICIENLIDEAAAVADALLAKLDTDREASARAQARPDMGDGRRSEN